MTSRLAAVSLLATVVATDGTAAGGDPAPPPHPVMFTTQLPIPADFATIGSTFANHGGHSSRAGRGGDLYIRYPDGTLRNLTREAGYGESDVFQGRDSIAVRDPHVHPDGQKALFSMVIGATEERYEWTREVWQIFEVSGLAQGQAAVVVRVARQPDSFNNVSPVYSPDGRIVFTSDRPRNGASHLYPQHDEYESTETVSGLWALDPQTGALQLLDHAPSGAFTPIVDSFGRILYTRWDHLQRDQQADEPGNPYGTFDWADESASATTSAPQAIFPESRYAAGEVNGHRFNHFFPWQIHPDGTGHETLNHVGRHELHTYFDRSFANDPDLDEFIAAGSGRGNPNPILNFFHVSESPEAPGRYLGVDAPEFGTHASGQIVEIEAPPGLSAGSIAVDYLTHPDTSDFTDDGVPPPPTHSGHYREPLRLADGRVLAVHSSETRYAANEGTRSRPDPRYDFRLRFVERSGAFWRATDSLLPDLGITRAVEYWDPDVKVSYDGPMWELSPVEVRPRPTPPVPTTDLETPEATIFADEGVDPDDLVRYLESRRLALIVSRDVTTRDSLDRQQPFNLRVPGGATTVANGGRTYDVSHLQIFRGEQVRGIGGAGDPRPGRRVVARILEVGRHNPASQGPSGSVALATDGSMAAIVPAERALAWQLTSSDGEPVVRERYWLTFKAGEIRVCSSCHGLTDVDQTGETAPENPPEALRSLLRHWQQTAATEIFTDGFESGDLSAWSSGQGD